MSFQTPITIKEAIENIEYNKYLLPAIQREFVWKHTNIEWLFDSLMRNYPISCFLFWQVEGETRSGYRFYKFLNEYRETFKTHNIEISTDGINDFQAILDGQQRLTSLYLGLKGSYAYREYNKSKSNDDENTRPTRHLYLNITRELEEDEDGKIYEFKFLKKIDTNENAIYTHKNINWFRVGKILELQNLASFNKFLRENNIDDDFATLTISKLHETIHSERLINFFLEKEQSLDKALNIFIRINSGGEQLNFSDLIMSIAIANWKKDARKEIHSLVDSIRDNKGYSITKDFILKVFLYLYSKDIKFKVKNFQKENAQEFEDNWEKIRNTITEVFELINKFGFTNDTLTSNNALIPIIYYLYHRNIYTDFSIKTTYKADRTIINKWLNIVLVKKVFGSSSDTILTQVRSAFTDNIEENNIINIITEFPSRAIFDKIKKDTTLSDEYIETELLCIQKDNQYAFSILSLLYPNLDYRNNTFHKDHLYPISKFTEENINALSVDETIKKEYYFNPCYNNGIYNLQMLDANENMSKNDIDLNSWIEKETENKDREQFLTNHILPNVNFSFENFKEFIDERKKMLMRQLKVILN